MSKAKYKVGDLVEILDNQCSGLVVGSQHKITNVERYAYRIGIWSFQIDGSTLKLIKSNNMKKIVGYKLKKESPEADKGTVYTYLPSTSGYEGAYYQNGQYSDYYYLREQVESKPQWFEPIYSSEVEVELSNHRIATIKSKTLAHINLAGYIGDIKASDVTYTLDAFNKLGQIAGYNVAIKEFQLGCQTFTIADLEAVDEAFKDFK